VSVLSRYRWAKKAYGMAGDGQVHPSG